MLFRQNSTLHVFNSWDKTVVYTLTHTHTPVWSRICSFWPSWWGWVAGWVEVSKSETWKETLAELDCPPGAFLVGEAAAGHPCPALQPLGGEQVLPSVLLALLPKVGGGGLLGMDGLGAGEARWCLAAPAPRVRSLDLAVVTGGASVPAKTPFFGSCGRRGGPLNWVPHA